ncbi:MAG TPA: 4-hydroxythreonine-4-phosphate dehydrogenase PdxA, partial [Mucilaginibacter sp.]|nr:4-hydroxythreonine-4-phosphate dehydrogenase PdxA [Mucilaginibacter sp.]
MSEKLKIGISIGDVNGIGLEVIIKTLADHKIYDYCTPIVYGQTKIASFHRRAINVNELNFYVINHPSQAQHKRANMINCWEEDVKIDLGEVNETGGKYAFLSLQHAVNDLVNGDIDALVTAPINKDNIQRDDFKFPGHTEYLQERAGAPEVLMFLVSDMMKVGVVTGHIPLKEVAASITSEKILAKLKLMETSLRQDFWVRKPKIAVLGLNPHAGDNGLMGDEEQKIIIPAIEEAKANDILAFGPYPADGFFANGSYMKFDAVLAMYHDQGLIPFKQVSFDSGVNFTAGLNFVRTSPDHGTAYDI